MEVLKILNKVVLLRPMLAFVSTDVSVRIGRSKTTSLKNQHMRMGKELIIPAARGICNNKKRVP